MATAIAHGLLVERSIEMLRTGCREVLVDGSAWRPLQRSVWVGVARGEGARVEVMRLGTTLGDCLAANERRPPEERIDPEVLSRTWREVAALDDEQLCAKERAHAVRWVPRELVDHENVSLQSVRSWLNVWRREARPARSNAQKT